MSLPIVEAMLVEVYRLTKLKPAELRSKSREHRLVRPRQAVMLAIHERTDWSLNQIAHFIGVNDHTTVKHGIKVARELSVKDEAFAALVESLRTVAPIMPGCLEEQVERVAFGLAPMPEGASKVVSPAAIIAMEAARIRAAERQRTEFERLRQDVNDDGTDWSAFDWRSGLWAHCTGDHYGSTVGEDGECRESRVLQKSVIAGSKRLLAAIEQARAA